jgi:CBS domain-containing protein
MAERGYKGIPVLSAGKVVGIVTMTDVERIPKEKAESAKLKEVMTKNVITTTPDSTLLEALHKMTTNDVGRLPVLDPDTGKLVGIMTRTDLFRAYDKLATSNLYAGTS